MIPSIVLILVSCLLSAFCSGVETGMYRVQRVRLVLDALDGSRLSRGLLWLTNHPGLFVSTLLFGNNVANQAFTIGVAWFIVAILGYDDPGTTVFISILSTPILFIFCELLPKSLFYQIPHRLLKTFGLPLMVLTILSLPFTWGLYLLSRWIQKLLGEEPLRVRPALARRELRQVLEDGQQAGLLTPVQRDFIQNLFAYGSDSIVRYCMPIRGLRTVVLGTSLEELKQVGRKSNQSVIPVLHEQNKRLVGYYDTSEVAEAKVYPSLHPIPTFEPSTGQITVLNQMVSQKCKLARVLGNNDQLMGVVLLDRLVGQMIQRS